MIALTPGAVFLANKIPHEWRSFFTMDACLLYMIPIPDLRKPKYENARSSVVRFNT